MGTVLGRGAVMVKLGSLLLPCALAVCLAAAAAAQDPGPVRETAEVSLVEVPVRVTGRDGAPVRGLEAKDFSLVDDGRRQEIVGFDAVDLAEHVAAPGGGPPPGPARRRFLILFDFSFARPKSIVAARKAARDFVLDGMAGTDLAAVAVYSVERGIRLLETFTSDRAQLARAIETLGIEAPRGTTDPLAFAFDTSSFHLNQPRTAEVSDTNGRSSAQASLVEHLQAMQSVNNARADEYQRGRVRNLIQSFRDLGRALDAVQGRKDVIYLSEGFAARFLVGTRESDLERQWLIAGEQWKVDSEKRFGDTTLRTELADMGDLMRRSDCVIHAVDIAGIRSGVDAEAGAPQGPADGENSLFEIANGSGGEVFRNTNDLRAQLDALVAKTSLVYVLAFRPDRSRGEGAYHEIGVSVSAHGAKVSARPGYYERRGFRRLSPFERTLSAADVIANEIPMQEIPIRVLVTAFASGEPAASVPLLIEVPGGAFLTGQQGERTTAEIYVYATDADNQLADFLVQSIGLDLAKGRSKLQATGLKYYGEMRLPAGRYRLRALVRNGETGKMGLSVSSLIVPAFTDDQPYLAAPLFLDGTGDWILVRGRRPASPAGAATSGGGAPPSTPLELPGEGLAASAEPEVQPGSPSRVCVIAYHFGTPGGNDELRLNGQIIAFDGRPVQEGPLAIVGKTAAEPDGKRVVLLAFTAPANLAAGRYGLRIFVQDAAGRARQAWAPFRVP
jgi:VWFA-related protein